MSDDNYNSVDDDIDALLGEMDTEESTDATAPVATAETDSEAEAETVSAPEPIAALIPDKTVNLKERITIIVHGGREEDAKDVFLSVNGKAFQIQRGVKVSVPKYVLGVLDDAVESKLVQVREGQYELRDYPRFSYQVVA